MQASSDQPKRKRGGSFPRQHGENQYLKAHDSASMQGEPLVLLSSCSALRNIAAPCSSSSPPPLTPPVSCFSHVWPSDERQGDRQRCQLLPPTERLWETTQPEDGRGGGGGRVGLLTFPHQSLIEISQSQSTCQKMRRRPPFSPRGGASFVSPPTTRRAAKMIRPELPAQTSPSYSPPHPPPLPHLPAMSPLANCLQFMSGSEEQSSRLQGV